MTDGAETNAVIMDVNATYDDGFVYSEGNAEFGHTELGRLGLIGNGPDGVIGKHDMDRVQKMIDQLIPVFGPEGVNIGIDEGVTPGDIATNEFIDDSIGLATTLADTWEIIQDYVDENGLNGASFIVVDRDAGVLYEEHTGELGPGRIAMIGPLSEMISAGVVLRLHEDGLLDVDAPVADVVAWGSGNPEVTLAQLLSHSSGMVGGLPSQFYAPYTCSVMFIGSLQGCGETIFTTPDDDVDLVPPDTNFGWPGTGADYQVAGAVAEAASGKTWAELVDETYAPCGLEVLAYNNPWFQLPFDPATFAYPSAAFDGDPSTLAPTDNPSIEAGAYTTPEDYAALLLMHLRDGMCGDQRVLSTESLERMHEDRIARVYDGGNPAWDPETGDATGGVWGYGMGFMMDREVGGRPGMATPFGQQTWMDLDTGYAALLLLESSFPDALALYDLVPDALHEAILTARG